MMEEKNCNPLISIVVPVYNMESSLEKCMGSILNQTYDNFEAICVDDGSTDQSGLILDKFAKYNSKIVVVHTKNRGVSSARNIALSVAKGDYIGFVDSDDYIHKDMYKVLADLILKNDVDIVSCGYYFEEGCNVKQALNQKEIPLEPLNLIESLYYIYKRDEYKGVAGYLWTRLFKKDLIKDSRGNLIVRFDENLNVGQDIVFLAELFRNVKKVLFTEQALYYYCQRENSTVHDEAKQIERMSWIQAYEKIIKIYKEMKVPEDLLDIIIRMYVYRCGKTLEIAIKYNNLEKITILKNKIIKYMHQYKETNQEHPERIQWILKLLSANTV